MGLFGAAPAQTVRARGIEYVVRPLERGDFGRGFLEILGQLTSVGSVPRAMFHRRLAEMERDGSYVVAVAERGGAIVGAATLLVERKFIHECGAVGHVEDVVVDESMRGLRVGAALVDYLVALAWERACYKVILDCSEKNVPFYEKCGFARKEVHMALYKESLSGAPRARL